MALETLPQLISASTSNSIELGEQLLFEAHQGTLTKNLETAKFVSTGGSGDCFLDYQNWIDSTPGYNKLISVFSMTDIDGRPCIIVTYIPEE